MNNIKDPPIDHGHSAANMGVFRVGHGQHVAGIRPILVDDVLDRHSDAAGNIFCGKNRRPAAVSGSGYASTRIANVGTTAVGSHYIRGCLGSPHQNAVNFEGWQPIGCAHGIHSCHQVIGCTALCPHAWGCR